MATRPTRPHDRLGAAFHLAAFTGLRRGELLALRWRDIDLEGEEPSISVMRSMTALHHQVEITDTKSTYGTRVVALDADTVTVLRAHRAAQGRERMKAGPAWEDQDGLVFTSEDGVRVHPDWFSKRFVHLSREAGVPQIRLHDLRHGWASLAGKHGVPLRVIQERLGHHDPAFTARQYQHVLRGMGKAGAETFAAAIRAAGEQQAVEG